MRDLVALPGGPVKVVAISEEWSSDCRRDVPVLAKLAEATGLEMRIFSATATSSAKPRDRHLRIRPTPIS